MKKNIFELVKEGEIAEIREAVENNKALLKEKDFNKKNLIMFAAQRGDEEIFNYLLKEKAPFKGSDNEKNTSLHYAMKGNNFNIIKTLIDKKIKVEQVNKKNEPAIISINKDTTPEIMELFLKKHDLNEIYETEYYKGNILYFVAMKGNVKLLEFIFDKGIKIGENNYIYISLKNGNVENAEFLFSKGIVADLTEQELINIISSNNNLNIVKFLVEKLNMDMSKNTIIDSFDELNILQHYINEYYLPDDKKLEIVVYLIEHGADINYLDHGKRDAMYYALKNNNLEIAEILLKKGASYEIFSNYLIKFDDYYYDNLRRDIKLSTIKFVLKKLKKEDLQKVTETLNKVIMKKPELIDNFIKYSNFDDMKYFIDFLNLDVENQYFNEWGKKYSIFTKAIYLSQINIIRGLLDMGVDINRLDANYNPPIYYLLYTNNESVIDILNLFLEHNVDLNIKFGKKGKGDLLLSALLNDNYYIAKFLFEHGLKLRLSINNYFKMKGLSHLPSFRIIKLLINNGIDLDTSDVEILSKVLLSVSKNIEDFLYLINRYSIDITTFDTFSLKEILSKIVSNKDLTPEENLINFKKFVENFNLNTLNDDMKTHLINNSVKTVEIFKLIEEEFDVNLSDDDDILKALLENIVNLGAVDTLSYILSKDAIIIYDIYDNYKETLRLAKKRNKDRHYYEGYEKRAQNFDEITKILKKYDKEIKKKVKKGELKEKEEIKLTEEEELMQKLNMPWIDLNELPHLYFKSGEKISSKVTLMLLYTVKSFGYGRILEQIQNITSESILELFKYLKEHTSKEMWIYDLLLALAENDLKIYPIIEDQIEHYGYSGGYHLQNQLINKLVEIKNIEGLKLIYKLTKSKRNSIKNSANKAFRSKSYMLGVSIEELKDMLISDFGLDSNKELVFDYGSRNITVKLMPDFKLTYTDKSINKTYKTLPKATKADDANKVNEATLFIKKMKKEIKKIVSDMKARLNLQFTDPKFNKFSYWKELFVKNPVLNVFASNLFWGIYKDEKLEKVFIYTEDGSFLDINQNEILINDNDLVSLLHPIELTEEELEKAKEFIDDYEITQPLTQINRQIFKPKDKDSKKLMDFNGKIVKSNTFHFALTKAGFFKGIVEDNGTIFTYYMDVKDTEILVVMSGITIGFYDNSDIEIYEAIFRKGKDIELGKVNSRIFSEVYLVLSSL